jgi:hypothetical protein
MTAADLDLGQIGAGGWWDHACANDGARCENVRDMMASSLMA